MLYVIPEGTVAVAVRAYRRPYENPIAAVAGAEVRLDPDRTVGTDLLGWAWCQAADDREGWVPKSWLERQDGCLLLRRDFAGA